MSDKQKMKNENKYRVEILGDEFKITGDLNQEYVDQLQELINEIGQEISRAYPDLPRRRLWMLTLINMADKYFKAEDQKKQHKKEIVQLKEKQVSLKSENDDLKDKLDNLQAEYEELATMLEEVDN